MEDSRIIDEEVKQLVAKIESKTSLDEIDSILEKLVLTLQKNCQKPSVRERYASYAAKESYPATLDSYPLNSDGYAKAFDPVEDEIGFRQCWEKYGFVVGKSVISKEMCHKTVGRMKTMLQKLSHNNFNLDDSATYDTIPKDENNVPCISRGFFEVYHDDSLAQLRQSIRVYLHYVLIWGKADLWTSFDRYGIKLPSNENSKGLPYHVDQNPLVHKGFQTTQGVLALVDCPVPQGTFVAVPGSRNMFPQYKDAVMAHDPDYRGEYVEAAWNPNLNVQLTPHAQEIPIRAGDLVSWDSRTTHGNSPNLMDSPRMVAYIAAGPVVPSYEEILKFRKEGFVSGIGKNVREAMMHASKPPRYSMDKELATLREPEKLTYLGRLLYGEEPYPLTK